MKKTLSIMLVVLLLLSLTACGKKAEKPSDTTTTTTVPAVPEDENYVAAMAKLEEGNWQEAYDLFKASADPRAAEELEKFAFVPTTVTRKSSNGRDLVDTYTYDERGNLLSDSTKGDYSWTMETDNATTYTYDEQNRKLSYTYYSKGKAQTVLTYTYDADGHMLTQTEQDVDGVLVFRADYTYDEKGNELTCRKWYNEERESENSDMVYTYDAQNRLLTRTVTYEGEEPTVYTYVYEEDGTYRYFYDYHYEGDVYTNTYWYDTEDRIVKHEVLNKDTDQVEEYYENRYDEKGNDVYHRSVYYGVEAVRTTTYNEQGQVLVAENKKDGETYSMTTYIYNEAGKPLTHEYFYGDGTWGRTTCTYDEQNRLLTEKQMHDYGWKNLTFTYDEAGNMVKVEQTGSVKDFVCEYTHDIYGNVLTYDRTVEDSDGGITVEQNTVRWELRYYPDGYSDEVRFAIGDVDGWLYYE